ncbi:Transcriptional regulator of competence genes, TfoX/Sxy family [Devosia sp. YR412]|uniref:TfoX/Sxy family protein n=1 Tax=Devosia sp. YR412 TaxID=1881030 RepID=UPI0008C9D828|nr:TfoX/Sxy family protein [Devosia sp. YR412]SEP97981.1 Transcriptional regulator of competence genes, TfoX/Sxy family [Devosia sp. YR412]
MSLASEDLSDRIRDLLPPMLPLSEKKMFGGRCFMLAGNMLVCPMKDGSLLVRVGKEGYEEALALPGASKMDMGERTMAGFVAVSGDVLEDENVLQGWIGRARAFVDTLPPK